MRRVLVILVLALGLAAARAEPDRSIEQLLQQAAAIAAELPATSRAEERELAAVVEHLKNKRYLETLAGAREIIRKNPDHMPARFVAANALIALNRYDAARTLLEQMLDRFPRHPGLLNNLAWMYATATDPAQRRPAEAVALARRALVVEPGDFHIWSTMAEAYFANREFSRALRAAEEALRMAKEKNVSTRQIITYEQQVAKCREAVTAYSIYD